MAGNWDPDCPMDLNDDFSPLSPPSEGSGSRFGLDEDMEISELGLGLGLGFGIWFLDDSPDGMGLEDLEDSIDGEIDAVDFDLNSEGGDGSDDAGDDNSDDLDLLLYESLFGEVPEDENLILGRPPTANTILENLPSIDTKDDDTTCAICTEEIAVGTQAKRLPCGHLYHGECILPWLRTRNTCPLCRFELPTDDPT